MCLYLCPQNHPDNKPLIASEDIVVYKIIKLDNKSKFYDFQYEPNTDYQLDKTLTLTEGDITPEVHEGFHFYCNLDDAIKEWYSYMDKLVECIIPKGAKYYIGFNRTLIENIAADSIRTGDLSMIDSE